MSAVSEGDAPVALTGGFAEALARIREIVGAEHVLERWEQIEPRARDTIPAVLAPSAIVSPGTADEARAVVRIAYEQKVALWPISRGKNWAYGASTPSIEGTIVLTLERLDRIVEVNEELAYAVIEPGVTFAQLHVHLERHRIPLWIDPTDSTPHGSVIGNALDHGIGATPYADHFANLCGLEVILADGRVLHSNGRPNSHVLHTHKWGTGPSLDGLFGQSGLGVVVKAGVWLMPAPEEHQFYVLEIDRDEDLPHVVDGLRRLVLEERIRTQIHILNDVGRIALVARCPFGPDAERTHLTASERAALRRRHGLPLWIAAGGLYGTRRQVREQRRELRQMVGRYGKLRFLDDRKVQGLRSLIRGLERARRLPGLAKPVEKLGRRVFGKSLEVMETLPHAYGRSRGAPTGHFLRFAYYKARRPLPEHDPDPARDGGGLIWFAPSLPFTGRHLSELLGLCRPLFEEYGFDFAAAVMGHNTRSVSLVMGITYYKDSPREAARADALYRRLCEVTAAAGYPRYRVSAPHQEHALDDAPEYRAVVEQIRGALDPDGIMAPGRYGVGGRR
jgi:4-cresol dehydrogenase (hydroxylating) flavoprotein subunit